MLSYQRGTCTLRTSSRENALCAYVATTNGVYCGDNNFCLTTHVHLKSDTILCFFFCRCDFRRYYRPEGENMIPCDLVPARLLVGYGVSRVARYRTVERSRTRCNNTHTHTHTHTATRTNSHTHARTGVVHARVRERKCSRHRRCVPRDAEKLILAGHTGHSVARIRAHTLKRTHTLTLSDTKTTHTYTLLIATITRACMCNMCTHAFVCVRTHVWSSM